MSTTDLMLNDFILVDGQPKQIARIWKGGIRYKEIGGNEIIGKAYSSHIEPISLTPEILEKNGFTKYDVEHNVSGWSILDEYFGSIIPFTLTDNDFDTKPGVYKWGPVEDDREASYVREIGKISYVHELQHLLKQCKIKKEIVL